MSPRRPIVTTTDHSQLTVFTSDPTLTSIADHGSLSKLRAVLSEAQVVADDEINPDTVTLESECFVRDVQTGENEQYTLVFPDEANITKGYLSVLAPLGASLLRQPDNSTIRVPCQLGRRVFLIERLLYQPEAAEAGVLLSQPVLADKQREYSA